MSDLRRLGRPRIDDDEESVPVSTRLPLSQYDELTERARRADVSVAEQIRRDLDPKFRIEK